MNAEEPRKRLVRRTSAPMRTPLCSVVIPTRDRHRELERALRSVAELEYPQFETIVVDNSFGDPSVHAIARRFNARVIVEPRRGVSFARNRGALESKGEIIAFMDDDTVADRGWLGALVRELSDPSVTMVSGPYLSLGPARYEALYNPGPARTVLERTTIRWRERAAFGSPARGGNMALRASVFSTWDGFVPELGRGTPLRAFPWNEIPACGSDDCFAVLQLVGLGHKFVYTPDAVVRHVFPATSEELRAFHYRMLSGWGMYCGFLFGRGYRRTVLRYVFGRLAGRRLRNAPGADTPFPEQISGLNELCAGLKGLMIYFRVALARNLYRLDSPVLTMGIDQERQEPQTAF